MERSEVFENLDRLVPIELRPGGLPVGVVPRLYAKAGKGRAPLALTVAQRLPDARIKHVQLVTGVVIPSLPHGEVDGPIGSAVLADALTRVEKQATVIVPSEMRRAMAETRKRLHGEFEIVIDGDDHALSSAGLEAVLIPHTAQAAPVHRPTTPSP